MIGLGYSYAFGMRPGKRSTPPPGPTNTVAPEITYSEPVEIGTILTCSDGTWTTLGTISGYTYQWREDGVDLVGETSSTYTLVSGNDDTEISCLVLATDEFGTRSKISNTVGPFDLVVDPGGTFTFLRPGGVDSYFRPGGVDTYLRP